MHERTKEFLDKLSNLMKEYNASFEIRTGRGGWHEEALGIDIEFNEPFSMNGEYNRDYVELGFYPDWADVLSAIK